MTYPGSSFLGSFPGDGYVQGVPPMGVSNGAVEETGYIKGALCVSQFCLGLWRLMVTRSDVNGDCNLDDRKVRD